MAIFDSTQAAGLFQTPVVRPNDRAYGGRSRCIQATVNYASQVAGTDQIRLGVLPAGCRFSHGIATTSVSTGSAVFAIGTSATHGSNGQYRAAAALTSVDTPTLFGPTAANAAAAAVSPDADQIVWMTWASANLPASGTLDIKLFYIAP